VHTGTPLFSLRRFFLPKNNHWLRRNVLVFAFVLFDYSSTVVFCQAPCEEANIYARIFMDNFGITLGLTLFVLMVNLPIYVTLCLDSYMVKLPHRTAIAAESFVDIVLAWFVAGLHFSGAASWFWFAPDLIRHGLGALLYLITAFLFVRPYRPRYNS